MNEHYATFVDIILPLYLPKPFTYRVPNEMLQQVEPGKRVVVQFGRTRVFSALVYRIHHHVPVAYEAKYILSVLDETPLVDATQLKFWEWISRYYMCTLGEVMAAALPAPFKLQSTTRILANEAFENPDTEWDDREYLVLEALDKQKELSVDEVQQLLQVKNAFPILKSLIQKGAIRTHEELKDAYKPKTKTCVRLAAEHNTETGMENLFLLLAKKEKQTNTVLAYLLLKEEKLHVEKGQLLKHEGSNPNALNTLITKGVFESYELTVDRIHLDEIQTASFELSTSQQQALGAVTEAWQHKDVVLLHGATSSGKTHLYVKLIEETLSRNQQVLFLLPEIALTSQIVNRVRKYFGKNCMAFHSKFSDNERVEIWNKVQAGDINIIIGPRSAIFLPYVRLGLVIVDEEHENTYKQTEPAPRYHARDAAIMLASLHGGKSLLGSATPSFESYFNSKSGKYALVEMHQRFGDLEHPEILLGNIAEEARVKTLSGNFTSVLYEEIGKTLAEENQVILFQNRRGYSPVLECENCQWVPRCQNCDISLTYHKFIDSLKCHYCGFTQKLPDSCHACGHHELSFKGFGTEKIEDELNVLFPEARVGRLDLDAARSKHGHEQIISEFEQHKFDILVGTQMLSKGLDFAKVSLVGIVNADQLLYFPDFRANERAFQLIMQVSGRGGRRQKRGKVVIQTSSPGHHVIQAVCQNDYAALYLKEMQERSRFGYPPFQRILKICIKHKDYKVAEQGAFNLRAMLADTFGDNILGPESPYISKIRNYFIKELLIKIERGNPQLPSLKDFVKAQIQRLLENKNIKGFVVFADVDAT